MTIKLPRLPANINDVPGLFNRYWDKAMTNIENSVNEVLLLPEIQAAITAANTAADNAQASATASTKESSLVNSYIDPTSYTDPLLSSDASGVVTIKTHTRVYGNPTLNPSKSVTGATVTTTGTSSGSTIRIYYTDASRAGGAVTYHYTIDPAAPPVQGNDVHSVGAVKVPASGTSDGSSIRPPGYVSLV